MADDDDNRLDVLWLPLDLSRVVFMATAIEARLTARGVCRAWRLFLADPLLWQTIDLSHPASVLLARRCGARLARAAALAHGRLRVMDLSGTSIPVRRLVDICASCTSIDELRLTGWKDGLSLLGTFRSNAMLQYSDIDALLEAVSPARLTCDAVCTPTQTLSLLSTEQRSTRICVHSLFVDCSETADVTILDVA